MLIQNEGQQIVGIVWIFYNKTRIEIDFEMLIMANRLLNNFAYIEGIAKCVMIMWNKLKEV